MKDKKKSRGMRHKIREEKKREQRIGLALTVAILIVIIPVSSFLIHSMLSSSPQDQETGSTSEPKAAIVDHLSLTAPNQTFIQAATNTLAHAGFTVDYYPGEEVTVKFYRNLPTHSYGLILLRVHSATTQGTESLGLFTSEHYDKTKYVYEQLTDRLVGAVYSEEDRENGIIYFGISPRFITKSVDGRFEKAVIVMMGCEGLSNTKMAEAFVQKGARVYISWNGMVSASHTDQATMLLLRHLIVEKQTVKQAIENTMKEVGADPAYYSILIFYPLEAADYIIQNIIGNIISNSTQVKTRDILKRMRTLFSFF